MSHDEMMCMYVHYMTTHGACLYPLHRCDGCGVQGLPEEHVLWHCTGRSGNQPAGGESWPVHRSTGPQHPVLHPVLQQGVLQGDRVSRPLKFDGHACQDSRAASLYWQLRQH